MRKKKRCMCRWVEATMLNRNPTYVWQACDACYPTEVEKLRVQVEKQMGLAADLRERLQHSTWRNSNREEALVGALRGVEAAVKAGWEESRKASDRPRPRYCHEKETWITQP